MEKKSGPWRITFDTNPDDCNLSCIMCEDHSPFSSTRRDRVSAGIPRRRMDIKLIKKILAEAEGTPLREIIPSTMGEPLLYQNFDDIIDLCHQYKIKLNLTTNGTFPKRGVEEWSHRLIPITSDIKISWNGATKETQEKIMLGTQWDRVLNNVKQLISIRNTIFSNTGHYCRITFQLTFLTMNACELADIVKLGIELGIDRIKGHHLWAHFTEIKPLSMRKDKQTIQRWNDAVREARGVANTSLLPNGKPILLENIYPLEDTADKELIFGGICPFLGKEAWVATNGRFSPCCAPDKERQKLGSFGNLNDNSMHTIWTSEEYQDLRKHYMDHDVCKHCNMRKAVTVSEPLVTTEA